MQVTKDFIDGYLLGATMELYEKLYHQNQAPNVLKTFDIIEEMLRKVLEKGLELQDMAERNVQ